MQHTPAPSQPTVCSTTRLYPVLVEENLSQPLHPTISHVQQTANNVIPVTLLPQPTPPHGHTRGGFPAIQKTSAQPLPPPQYPVVMPGPTAHHYKQVPPSSFPAVQRAPANPPPVVTLYEAPQTRGGMPSSSFPAVQRAPAQPSAPTSASSKVLFEAPKNRY